MQKNTKWYDLKKATDGYRIFFSFSIRIQAIFLLIFSLIMIYFEIFENDRKLNIIGSIIFGLIFLLAFIYSFLVDSFLLELTKSQIIRKKGIFPFVISKKIDFKEINSISSDIIQKANKRYSSIEKENIPSGYYSGKTKEYSISIGLNNGKIYRISFGKGNEELFNKFLEELKKIL
ncbi:MAG: hypothetical protein NUV32_02490 [Exilispira sp.]|jgi:hypothetical protein|nr:hypothetical protein [Exilispira sp.]